MLSTLVDNSTLTAVQRLIGDVGVSLSFPIEGDLSAYDNYLQSLLIYDEIASIDDYKEEFRSDRHRAFSEIKFLNPSNFAYDDVSRLAQEAAEAISFKISRGRLSQDPMAQFLKSLDLHVAPAWYMQSSEWFLRMRLLADEADVDLPKYGALMSAIRTQLNEADCSKADHHITFGIEDSHGHEIDLDATGNRSVGAEIRQFAAGLNWLAQRALFYAEAAERFKSAFTLHPIRHAFLGQYAVGHLMPELPNNLRAKALDFFGSEVGAVKKGSDELLGIGTFRLQLPFFAAWAVGHAGNPKDGYDHVLQIRYSPEAMALRSRFREIEAMGIEGDISRQRVAAAKLHNAIRADVAGLAKKFGTVPDNPRVDASVDLLSLTPSLSLSGLLKPITGRVPSASRKATTVLRSISRDVMQIPTMGHLSDQFYRSRRIRKGTGFNPERPRMEPRKYERSSTHFKKPL